MLNVSIKNKVFVRRNKRWYKISCLFKLKINNFAYNKVNITCQRSQTWGCLRSLNASCLVLFHFMISNYYYDYRISYSICKMIIPPIITRFWFDEEYCLCILLYVSSFYSKSIITPPRNRGGVIFSLQFVCVSVCLCVGHFLWTKFQPNGCTDLDAVFPKWLLLALAWTLLNLVTLG